jgi:anti-sigma factor RsiW
MLCRETKKLLGAFIDNELDVMTSLALEEHVEACVDCCNELEMQRSIKKLVREADLNFECPAELRQEILRALTSQEIAPAKGLWRHWGLPRWTMATAALVLFCLIGAYFLFRPLERTTVEQVVDNHIRSMQESHLTDVLSSDQHTVKPWFSGKLSFSPDVTDFSNKGYALVGGRLDYMNNQPVAVLIYKRQQHIINVFSYPSASSVELAATEKRGYNLMHWSYKGLECWMVSDLNRPELEEFAQLLKD